MEGNPFGNVFPFQNPPQPGTYSSPSSSRDEHSPHSTAAPAPAPFSDTKRANHPPTSQQTMGGQWVPVIQVVGPDGRNQWIPTGPPYPPQRVTSMVRPGVYRVHDNVGEVPLGNALMHGNGLVAGGLSDQSQLHPPAFPRTTTEYHDHERITSFSAGDDTMEDASEEDASEEDASEEDASKEDGEEEADDAEEEDDTEEKGGEKYDVDMDNDSKASGRPCEFCMHLGHGFFGCPRLGWGGPTPKPAARELAEDTALLNEDQEKYQRLAGKVTQIVWNLIPDSEQPPESHKTMMKHILQVLSDQSDNPEIVHHNIYGEAFQDKWLCIKAMCDPEYKGVVSLVNERCRYCRNPRRAETVTLCYQIMPRKDRMALYRQVGIVRA